MAEFVSFAGEVIIEWVYFGLGITMLNGPLVCWYTWELPMLFLFFKAAMVLSKYSKTPGRSFGIRNLDLKCEKERGIFLAAKSERISSPSETCLSRL